MTTTSLWPNLAAVTPPRGTREMLVDAVGDIGTQTNGDIQFYVDLVGVGTAGRVERLRYNCYLRAAKTGYLHLFFQVTTPSTGPWPATLATPEGDEYPDRATEAELRDAIAAVLQRPRTAEIVYYLRSMVR